MGVGIYWLVIWMTLWYGTFLQVMRLSNHLDIHSGLVSLEISLWWISEYKSPPMTILRTQEFIGNYLPSRIACDLYWVAKCNKQQQGYDLLYQSENTEAYTLWVAKIWLNSLFPLVAISCCFISMFHGNDSTLLIILQSAFFEIFETTHFGQIRYAEYNCGIHTSRLFHRLQIIQECNRQQATTLLLKDIRFSRA